jgi:hypothetical protein
MKPKLSTQQIVENYHLAVAERDAIDARIRLHLTQARSFFVREVGHAKADEHLIKWCDDNGFGDHGRKFIARGKRWK